MSETVLAFDIGLKRIGVASGSRLTMRAHPAGQIKAGNGQFERQKLDEIINEWQPNSIVIGNPNTTDTHLKKLINRFTSHIQQQHKIPIFEIDEELTTEAANTELTETKQQGHGLTTDNKIELRDQIAACLILESFLNSTDNKLV